MKHIWVFVLLASMLTLGGCESVYLAPQSETTVVRGKVKKNGPPPWAPAHGYRNKMRYRYYPGQEVYFNIERGQYVWLEHGAWRLGARLPDYIRLGDSVVVEIEGDHPNLYHRQIVQVYPPKKKYKSERKSEYRKEDHRGNEKRSDNRNDRKPGKDEKRGKGRGNSRK